MKRKTIFKILSILMITAFLLATINVSSYAALTSSSTGSITITELEKGVTAYAYRIATVNVDDATGAPASPEYSWIDAVKTWLETSSEYSTYADIDSFTALDETTDADTLADFYSAITSAIRSGDLNISVSATKATGSDADYPITTEESVTFSDMSMGLYVIYIAGGYQVYSPVVAGVIPEYASGEWSVASVTAEAKATSVSIEKELTGESTEKSSQDTLTYTITADVITYDSSAVTKTYTITDTYGSGLSIDTSDITVYGVDASGTPTELTSDYYTITEGPNSDGTSYFEVDFVYDNISAYASIQITYTATFNLGTGLDYTNIATLTYSSDPYEEETTPGDSDVTIGGDEDEPDVTIYLYGIEVTNADSTSYDTITEESTFQLYDEDGTLLYFYLNSDGIYYLVGENYSGASSDITTSNGTFEVYGLSTGSYTLKQTAAPSGYVLNSTTSTLTLTDATDEDGNSGADGILDGDDDEILSVTFTNGEGFSLPTTGGVGAILFTLAGIGLIVFGVRVGIKKEKED